MFTRLLIGLDGSPIADEALEQAVLLGRRFGSRLVVAHVQDGPRSDPALLDRARARVAAAGGLAVDAVLRRGRPEMELAALARDVDAVLVGRHGRGARAATRRDAIGSTVAALIGIAERCVIVCGSKPSPMRTCAVAYDGRETSQRALELAGRFASIASSELHIIHATVDPAMGTMVVGEAEAALSLLGAEVEFVTHLEHGTPGEAVARVIARTQCDALFAGAHVAHGSDVTVSHAEEILRHTDIPVVIQP